MDADTTGASAITIALAEKFRAAAGDAAATLELVRANVEVLAAPDADTSTRLLVLSEIGAIDVAAARVVEPNLDALSILDEAGMRGAGDARTTWGVFAAEAPGERVAAENDGSGWRLSGVKPWCSLAGLIDRALITAWVDDERRGLFSISLRSPGVDVSDVPWHARGLPGIVSSPVRLTDVAALAVGEPEWYLRRPGFAWGGIGVAACWFGAAQPLLQRLLDRVDANPAPDPLAMSRIGRAYRSMAAARSALSLAAVAIDRARSTGSVHRSAESLRANLVRGDVVDAVTEVLDTCRDVLGPGPAAFDEEYARRTADLSMYISQYHRGRDDARLARDAARLAHDAPQPRGPLFDGAGR